jgi:hypothetical protein
MRDQWEMTTKYFYNQHIEEGEPTWSEYLASFNLPQDCKFAPRRGGDKGMIRQACLQAHYIEMLKGISGCKEISLIF